MGVYMSALLALISTVLACVAIKLIEKIGELRDKNRAYKLKNKAYFVMMQR
jgi:hypothetical protein